MKWYVLTTKAKNENRACENLTNQGYETYLPLITVNKIQRGIKKEISEPLFPNYTFIRLDSDTANFNSIRSTRGVLGGVKFGTQILSINDAIIEQLKSDLDEHQNRVSVIGSLKSGDEVNITRGPFSGLKAIYQSSDGLERSILMLNFIQNTQRVVFNNTDFKQ